MLAELQGIGLSDKETRVYLAALEIGRATADQLAKHAKIKRPTTYVQLESLMRMGLMSTYEENHKTYFAPESPELLKRLLAKQKESIDSKERDLTSLLPDLLRQFESAGERPIVRFFPGKEGVTTSREEALGTKEKKIYTIFSYEHLRKLYSEKELDEYSDRRKELGIHSRGIHLHKPYFQKSGLSNLTERRFLHPKLLPLTIDISIFDNKTALRSLEGTLFGVIIESEQIAANMRMIFEFLWSSAEKPEDVKTE